VLKTGAVINPVNVMLTPSEVAYVTKDHGAKALIGSPEKVEPAGATPFAALIGDHTEFDPETFTERRRRRDASPPSLAVLDD
jgi:acyl-CoA synthetase (AMP-forming)/AMP-acid ligase II